MQLWGNPLELYNYHPEFEFHEFGYLKNWDSTVFWPDHYKTLWYIQSEYS